MLRKVIKKNILKSMLGWWHFA